MSFESGFAAWDQAYDDAVGGIEDAMDASGVNDSWWEDLLDGIATVATVVATIAVIAALVIGGPIFLAIAAVASIVALAAHCIMMACGSKRVSWTDIAFDAIGVLPFLGAFGKGLKAGQGVLGSLRAATGLSGATRATVGVGRNALVRDLRTVVGAGRTAGNRAARELAAPGLADTFLNANSGRWIGNAWNALRGGGSILDGQAFTISQRLAQAWPGAGRMGSNVTRVDGHVRRDARTREPGPERLERRLRRRPDRPDREPRPRHPRLHRRRRRLDPRSVTSVHGRLVR